MLVYAGALDKLAVAMKERVQRLKALITKVPDTHPACSCKRGSRCELHHNVEAVCGLFGGEVSDDAIASRREAFMTGLSAQPSEGKDYLKTIQGLPAPVSAAGVRWLEQIVDSLCARAVSLWQSVNIPMTPPAKGDRTD